MLNSTSKFPTFLLTGIPGLESAHVWISIPFCCFYAIALSGNSMILFVTITQQTTDLGLTVSSLSTTLGILWFEAREISLYSCIVQMFFLHGFTFMESGVLVAMAFDRYVAICDPLRYTTILTNSRIIQMGLLMITCAIVLILPLLLLLKMNALSHSYCYHPDVIQLACSDIRANSICGLIDLILTTGIDMPCIVLSYILIIHSVLRIASPEEWHKVFSTCVSHVGAVAIFYIPMLSLSLVYRYVHSVMANVYLLLPPVLNPIIYSVKTKQICKAMLSLLLTK
uniref:Olfactory receptor family 51 subfamily F member 1 n=1 Tax=Nomascus leucogenys TaxID=61853 RepID=A0A2I3HFK0_NOMLE